MARVASEVRRRQIVAAMREVMAVHGYAGATVAKIAAQAGLAPGLVHYHFADKAEILSEMIADLGKRLSSRVQLSDEATAWDKVDAWVDGLLGVGSGSDDDALRAWVSVGAEAVHRPDVRAAYGGWVALGQRELASRLAAAGVADADGAAVAGIAMIEGMFHLGVAAPGVVPEGTAAAAVKRMLAGWEGRHG